MHQIVSHPVDTSRRWWVLATVVAAQFMFGVDVFIVNVAIPTIAAELHASAAQIEAVIAVYLIAYATLVVTGGRLGDIYGARNVFISGVAGFTVTSLWCALAQSGPELIAARLASCSAASWSRLIWRGSAGVRLGLSAAGADLRDRFASWWSTRQISRCAGADRGLRRAVSASRGPILLCMGLFSRFCVWTLRCTAEEYLHCVRDTKSLALRANDDSIRLQPIPLQGLVMAPLSGAVLSTVKPVSAGAASGIYGTTAQIANAAGVAAIGAVYFAIESNQSSRRALLAACALFALSIIACAAFLTWMRQVTG